MWPVASTGSGAAIVALAVLAGLAAPALPTAMRRQWQQLLGREDPRLQPAYAFELNAQVAVFVIGPLLAAAGLATMGAGATLAATANSAGVGSGYVIAGAIIQESGTAAAFLIATALLAAATTVPLAKQQSLTCSR